MPLAALALLAAAAGASEPPERVLAAARDVIGRAGYCALVTLDEAGAPAVRAMDPFPPDADFTVWLGTRRSTRKVGHILGDPRVALHWLDPDGPGYVTLLGTAELVDDPAERERRFKPEWHDFYDDDWRGDDYLLIRVRPQRVEVMSVPAGVASEPGGWKPAAVEFPREEATPGY